MSTPLPSDWRPRLVPHARLQTYVAGGKPVLLHPEGVLVLNPTGHAILSLCDGVRTLSDIVAALSARFQAPPEKMGMDVAGYLVRLRNKGLLGNAADSDSFSTRPEPGGASPTPSEPTTYRPMALLAELTYRCPLHCPYCSNPTQYPSDRKELSTETWRRVLQEAAELGVLHAGFSGGEPLARTDLAHVISSANRQGLYTNLITSAVGLTRARLADLKHAGLDSVQISFQADEAELADWIAGAVSLDPSRKSLRAHTVKLTAARWVREAGLPLNLNVVLHASNIGRLPQIIALAEQLGAVRIELANTQYYGWAFQNKTALLPTREQVDAAQEVVAAARARLGGSMEIVYVMPDYHGDRPKPCMNGWGRKYLTVNPVGDVLPCPTAGAIPNLKFENVHQRSLAWIWNESDSFNRYRGMGWLPDPCRSCDRREIDFGGCRCQAALLTGDPAAADPACGLSPFRERLTNIVDLARVPQPAPRFIYRVNP